MLDEYKNKDLSDEKRQLNDKLARLDELNLYVGRVDKMSATDATIARLEARYGKEYQEIVDIVREKIDKENADEVLDISFAPKRSDESASKTNLQNFGKMSQKNKDSDLPKFEFTTLNKDKTAFELRPETLKALEKISNKPITNKNDGRVAYISRKGREKMTSDEAVLKSTKNKDFTAAQHMEIVKHIQKLYENAHLRNIDDDTKHGYKEIKMPRYKIDFILDGQPAQAKITLKETLKGLYKGNKIYTIELESVSKI